MNDLVGLQGLTGPAVQVLNLTDLTVYDLRVAWDLQEVVSEEEELPEVDDPQLPEVDDLWEAARASKGRKLFAGCRSEWSTELDGKICFQRGRWLLFVYCWHLLWA